jgi:hypothetical protein
MRKHTGGAAVVALWALTAGAAAALIPWAAGAAAAGEAQASIGADDIGGTVRSSRGPEAGIWVIAETTDLGTRYAKIVVTDDQGRFLIPGLPSANYSVWTRGYGLVDSPKVQSTPGKRLALTAVIAPSPQAAAQYYPADYWYSLLHVPPKSDFPGTGPSGNGIDPSMKSQDYWINHYKTNCNVCHQLGDKATRLIEKNFAKVAPYDSDSEAWGLRTLVGQDGAGMSALFNQPGRKVATETFGNWTERVEAGEVPPAPPRPQGVERNIVITEWEWGEANTFAHDELTTDKRHPTANANGPIYGVDWGNDAFLILNPTLNLATQYQVPVLDPVHTQFGKAQSEPLPSPYWGNTLYWHDQAIPNNAAMDSKGRVWMSARSRPEEDQPAYCTSPDSPWARMAPLKTNNRGLEYYDPRTARFHPVNTCFDSHHVRFANDKDETIYGNGVIGGTVGWVKTRVLDETGDVQKASGWCRPYFDINRDGKIDPKVDRPIAEVKSAYGVQPDPDGSVWLAVISPMPGRIVRVDPRTCVSEAYEPPFNNPAAKVQGYTPRGIDIDSHGVIWTGLAGSGHLASFDRRKCRHAYDPTLPNPGQQCPEGWTLHAVPGPTFTGTNVKVDFLYYNFVDQFNTLGLGRDVPLANGTNSDSILALLPNNKWVVMRVPYPMGFYQRGMDGRIDDPAAGWKGRALYADYGPNIMWHSELGMGSRSRVVKFQIRPDPLAR